MSLLLPTIGSACQAQARRQNGRSSAGLPPTLRGPSDCRLIWDKQDSSWRTVPFQTLSKVVQSRKEWRAELLIASSRGVILGADNACIEVERAASIEWRSIDVTNRKAVTDEVSWPSAAVAGRLPMIVCALILMPAAL